MKVFIVLRVLQKTNFESAQLYQYGSSNSAKTRDTIGAAVNQAALTRACCGGKRAHGSIYDITCIP